MYAREPEPIRRSYCNPCAWETDGPLPCGPSERFLMVKILSMLPAGVVDGMGLSFDLSIEVETMRRRLAPRLF